MTSKEMVKLNIDLSQLINDALFDNAEVYKELIAARDHLHKAYVLSTEVK